MFWYKIFPEDRFLVAGHIGVTSVQDMKDLSEKVWSDPDYDQYFNAIIDYSKAKMDFPPDGIEEVTAFFLEKSTALKSKVANIVTTPMETALHMLLCCGMASQVNIKLFSTWEAAAEYVGTTIPRPDGKEW